MAGDWIKMRVLITRDPKVIAIADHLAHDRAFMDWLTNPVRRHCDTSAYEHVTRSVTVSVTVTALLQVWGVGREQGRQHGDDLLVDCIDLDALDEIAGVPGFGDAMESVGWARALENGGVIFPKFFVQNATTEEIKRRQAAQRKQRQRQREKVLRDSPRDAERDSHASGHAEITHREEKRREEKKEEDPLPPAGVAGCDVLPFVPLADTPPSRASEIIDVNLWPQFVAAWTAAGLPGAGKVQRTPNRVGLLQQRLADATWRESWRQAIARAGRSSKCRGQDPKWAAGLRLDTFLKDPDLVTRILEGEFDDAQAPEATVPIARDPYAEFRAKHVRGSQKEDAA